MTDETVIRTTEERKRLQRANDRVRAASQRLNEANDELAAAEIEWRLANEALEEMENPSAHVAAGVTGHD